MSSDNGHGDGWQGEYRGYGEGLRDQDFGHGQERYYGSLGEQMDRSQRDTVSQRHAGQPGVDQRPADQRAGQRVPLPGRQGPPPAEPPPVVPAPEQPRRRGGAVAAVAAVTAILLAGGGFGAWKLTQKDETADPAASSSTPSSARLSRAPSPSSSTGIPPVKPGWVVNSGDQYKGDEGAFDTPPETERFTNHEGKSRPVWKVENPDMEFGVVSQAGRAGSHAPSVYRGGHCKNRYGEQSHGFFSWIRSHDDPATASGELSTKWLGVLTVGENGNKVTADPTRRTQIKVNGGKTPAVQSLTTLPGPDHKKDKCASPRLELRVIAFQGTSSTPVVIMLRDLGVPDQMPNATMNQIISTIRPVD